MNDFYETMLSVGGHHYNMGGDGGHGEFQRYISSQAHGSGRYAFGVILQDILSSAECESMLRLLVLLLGYTTARDYLLTGLAPVTSTLVLVIISLHISQHERSGVNTNYYKRYSFHPNNVVKRGQWYRLFTSPFIHQNALHLYLNLTSLSSLCAVEALCQMTSYIYFMHVLALIGATGIFHIGSCFDYDTRQEEWNMYTSGFTGVTFALKTVSNCLSPSSISNAPLIIPLLGNAYSYTIPFVMTPTFTHVFVELFLVDMIFPNVFCVWLHASGILAGSVFGILYTLLCLPNCSSDLFHGRDYGESEDDIPLYFLIALVAIANDTIMHTQLKIR